jgi:hypothetical protein
VEELHGDKEDLVIQIERGYRRIRPVGSQIVDPADVAVGHLAGDLDLPLEQTHRHFVGGDGGANGLERQNLAQGLPRAWSSAS